jgi:hypothetical protein
MGIQASALTMLLNPLTVLRVYDYELYVPADQDALTLAELMESITEAIWTEVGEVPSENYTTRQPMISSLRRNLQREHLDRLIDMAFVVRGWSSASKPTKTLAAMHLRSIQTNVAKTLEGGDKLDAYTRAHLEEVAVRVEKALDAGYIHSR